MDRREFSTKSASLTVGAAIVYLAFEGFGRLNRVVSNYDNKSVVELVNMYNQHCLEYNLPEKVNLSGYKEDFGNSISNLKNMFSIHQDDITEDQRAILVTSIGVLSKITHNKHPNDKNAVSKAEDILDALGKKLKVLTVGKKISHRLERFLDITALKSELALSQR